MGGFLGLPVGALPGPRTTPSRLWLPEVGAVGGCTDGRFPLSPNTAVSRAAAQVHTAPCFLRGPVV